MRRQIIKKRQGFGLLPVAICFCVLTSIVALALIKVTSGVLGGMEINHRMMTAQKIAESRAALLRGVEYGKLTAMGKREAKTSDYAEEVIMGAETVDDGRHQRDITVNVYYKNESQPKTQLVLTRANKVTNSGEVNEFAPIGSVAIWPFSVDKLPSTGDTIWMPCQGGNLVDEKYSKAAVIINGWFMNKADKTANYNPLPDFMNVFPWGSGTFPYEHGGYVYNTWAAVGARLGNSSYRVYGSFWTYLPSPLAYYGSYTNDTATPWDGTSDFTNENAFKSRYYGAPNQYSLDKPFSIMNNRQFETNYDRAKNRDENRVYVWKIDFNTANAPKLRTADENRPINRAVNFIIRVL